jgi:RIO kinase 1
MKRLLNSPFLKYAMAKLTKEKFKTYQNVFDNFTERTLFKLASEGHFDNVESFSPVLIGKESNVFSAKKGNKRVIVKIYRLETCDFNRMYDYIKYDPRYSKIKRQKRQIIFAWVQREYRNLLKSREGGVKVPIPYTFKNNVLVEEFIGDDEPAPMLKDRYPLHPNAFLKEIVKNIQKLYKAKLVHADLSHFNILNYKEKPVLIDFSQVTPIDDVQAQEYLDRDVRNLCKFFKKLRVKCNEEKIKEEITRC